MSKDMQKPLPSLKKEESSENESTVSSFTGENTPQLIHEPALSNSPPRVSRKRPRLNLGHTLIPVLDTTAMFFANAAKNGYVNNTNGINFEGAVEEAENESVLLDDSSSFTGENTPPSLSVTKPLPKARNNKRSSQYLMCTRCRRGFRTTQGLSRHQLTYNHPKDQIPPPSNLSFPLLDTSAMFFANVNSMSGGSDSIGMVDCTYLDEGEVRGEDGTIDLLSSVGMSGGENEKSDNKDGDEDEDEDDEH